MTEERGYAHLVVIGSSAGGIDALTTLLPTLPADFPAPVVIAQHIDPRRGSHLAEILSRHSTLAVRTITEDQPLEPGVVFVVPANRHVEITDHEVHVHGERDRGPKPSVDRLFGSAAEAFGEGVIAVILTGTGSDGAAGARLVKGAGGTVIIQDPETAAYPAMPLSLAPSLVDIVADLERMGPLLLELVTGNYLPSQPDQDRTLRLFLAELREHSGIDFNAYKLPTITRRLQRRMVATGTRQLGDYVRYTQSHPEEYQRLINSFLIKVTEFFRDQAVFGELKERILPRIIEEARARGREIRLWSAGCATGEEAYSLGILVSEALGGQSSYFTVRIFGTDLDANAVAFARQGVYPAAALAQVPSDLVSRYFNCSDGEYQISDRVRSQIIFGQHDLGQRAPFPRIDLVLCRNVLTYFTAELQKRALQLFAFSLRNGGYLVLGQAETAGALGDYLAPDHPRLKIYIRHGDRILLPPSPRRPQREEGDPPTGLSWTRSGRSLDPTRREPEGQRTPPAITGERLLLALPIGVVLIDRRYDIQLINTAARRLLGIHSPALGDDLIHLAHGVSSTALRAAIDAALRGAPSDEPNLAATVEAPNGEQRQIEITCYPHPGDRSPGSGELVLVVVNDVTDGQQQRSRLEEGLATERAQRQAVEEQVQRLYEANRELLSANEELNIVNTELNATNEGFLASNKEAQAATEEDETLNEELQATMEQLNTTNDDLQARNVDLVEVTEAQNRQRRAMEAEREQLTGILASIGDAVLVVDRDGNRLLSNDAYDAMFGSGRGIMAASDGEILPRGALPQARAARGDSFSLEFTIDEPGGSRRWYEASGRPLRSSNGEQRGGVLVIRDITDRSLRTLQETFLAMASHDLRTPLTALQVYLEMVLQLLARQDTSERTRHYVDLAMGQTRRLGLLVRDLVDVTRFQHGQVELELTEMELGTVVREAVEVAEALAKGQAIRLEVEVGPLRVRADLERLLQVLLNVLGNAITYAPGTERIDVRVHARAGQAEIEVQDYGPGIAAAELPNIFAPFHRATAVTAVQGTGLGLGLYIAHQLITAHSGTIEASSAPGEGAKFTIRLPLI